MNIDKGESELDMISKERKKNFLFANRMHDSPRK